MGFEEWWEKEWTPTSQPAVFDLAMKEIAAKAYRAGLLHAAEQDEKVATQHEQIEAGNSSILRYSAIIHREAAEELK
jgi:hypothetical protein